MLMSAYGTSENIKSKMHVSRPLSTQTGSKVNLRWLRFLLGRTEQKYRLQLTWQRCVFYTQPAILIMTTFTVKFFGILFGFFSTVIQTLLDILV